MQERIDRRAARTRRALHEALISLISRKGYEAITVQDILDEADVGRSTFYAHYSGKESLLRGSFESLRAELTLARRNAAARHNKGPLAFSSALFEHACARKTVYRALAGGRGGVVTNREMRRVLSNLVEEELSGTWQDGIVSRELGVQFVVSVFLTVLTSLLMQKPKLSPPQADRMFRQLVMDGIGASISSAFKVA